MGHQAQPYFFFWKPGTEHASRIIRMGGKRTVGSLMFGCFERLTGQVFEYVRELNWILALVLPSSLDWACFYLYTLVSSSLSWWFLLLSRGNIGWGLQNLCKVPLFGVLAWKWMLEAAIFLFLMVPEEWLHSGCVINLRSLFGNMLSCKNVILSYFVIFLFYVFRSSTAWWLHIQDPMS